MRVRTYRTRAAFYYEFKRRFIVSGKIKTFYRGWDITVRCLKFRRPGRQAEAAEGYTASALAVLRDKDDGPNWVDSRSQRSTAVHRMFDSTAGCAEALLAEVKVLIDSMRKPPTPAG